MTVIKAGRYQYNVFIHRVFTDSSMPESRLSVQQIVNLSAAGIMIIFTMEIKRYGKRKSK